MGKFESRTDEGIFLGYSSDNKACRCYNIKLYKVVTSVDVIVDHEELSQISNNWRSKEEDNNLKI